MLTLAACGQANASFIQHVSGGDMAGIVATVVFADGSSDSAVWVTDTDPVAGYATMPEGWIVYLSGDSFGQEDDEGNLLGEFMFESHPSLEIVSLTLEMLAAGFVFDTEFYDESANGSGDGREFFASIEGISASYDDFYMDELYGTMTISYVGGLLPSAFSFMTDTDMISEDVPAPAGIALFALALIGFRFASRKA